MNRRLLGGHEAGAHIDAVRPHGQRRRQPPAVPETAGGDEGYLQPAGRKRQQDQVGDVVLPRMAGALEAVHADDVAADFLGLQGMANGSAFVNHGYPRLLDSGQIRLGVAPRRLDDLHPGLHDGLGVFIVRHGLDGGQDGEVHGEGPVGHPLTSGDLLRQSLRRGLGEGGEGAQGAGVGDGGGEFGEPHPLHPPLNDGMLDAEFFGESGFHCGFLCRCVG